jgi:dTDP-4-amino-4,6-dideoxygalactose transaminase
VIPRALPPVYSPLTPGALLAGWRVALDGGRAERAALDALLAQRFPRSRILCTDSGTSALALGLRSATAAAGRRVVALPGWSCYDLATAAVAAGVDVLLYDLDPDTLGPDWDSLDRVLNQGPAAVVVVHAFGLPVNLPEVMRRAGAVGAMVIEDAAQATGASLQGSPAGATGDFGVLSFGRGKGWTGGGGGALVCRRPGAGAFEDLPPGGRGQGAMVRLTIQWLLGRPSLYAIPSAMPFLKLGETVYRAPEPPRALAASAAAVVRRTALLQQGEAETRRRNAERLTPLLLAGGARVPRGWEGGRAGWLRLPFLPRGALAQAAGQLAARRLGVMPGYPMPLERLPGFGERIGNRETPRPGAALLAELLCTVPTHGLLAERDLARLERWIQQATR